MLVILYTKKTQGLCLKSMSSFFHKALCLLSSLKMGSFHHGSKVDPQKELENSKQ